MRILKKGKNVIAEYVYKYPQLTCPVEEGMGASDIYKDIVLRGKLPKGDMTDQPEKFFLESDDDSIMLVETPVGTAEVLYLAERQDFERFLRCISYKCEPVDIPKSTGAMHISGIANWRKIHKHRDEYMSAGNFDWNVEFKRFISEPANFKDTLLIVSKGPYSALSHAEAGFSEEEWISKSLVIRTYHELTHYVCRKGPGEKKDAIWEELAADCIGLMQAFGYYDEKLAQKFLGVEGNSYKKGGRLENYVDEETPSEKLCEDVKMQIGRLAEAVRNQGNIEIWQLLEVICNIRG